MATNISSVQKTYAIEAQKRLRSDGQLQSQDVQQSTSARIRHLAQYAWTYEQRLSSMEPSPTSEKRTKFLIVGAGIGGIVSAVSLVLAGFSADQIRLVETAGGVGGTRYWNRFPGLHCDIESYVYMPPLGETGHVPSQKYASGAKMCRYLQKVVDRYQLHDKLILGTKVDSLRWEEQDRIWKAELSSSQNPALTRAEPPVNTWGVEAEFVILTAGYLARPQVPTLDEAGVGSSHGAMFHTARWDYGVTDGSSEDAFPQLEKLRDKRVGIIGTGATAIQVVPCLAKHAKKLFVFRRSRRAVCSRGQQDTAAKEWKDKTARSEGWHRDRMENMTARMSRSAASGSGTWSMMNGRSWRPTPPC